MTWRRTTVTVLACAGLLVGCTPSGPAPTSPTTPAATALDAGRTDPATLADKGTFRGAISALPAHWNPTLPLASPDDAPLVFGPLYGRAFVRNAAGQAKPDPDYVEDVRVSHQGPTIVALTLNRDAVWGDGTPITASDWIATWKAQSAGTWAPVASVAQGRTAQEVVVTYKGVDPDWVRPLEAGPLRAQAAASASDAKAWATFDAARANGPFVVTAVDADNGIVTLEPNPRWWGDAPRLHRIMLRVLSSDAAPAAFRANELDYLPLGFDTVRRERAQGASDAEIRLLPGVTGRELVLRTTGDLADARVRRAIVRALDRSTLGQQVRDSETSYLWSDPLALPTQAGYSDVMTAAGLTYDAQAAGDLLDEAGWTRSGATRSKAGRPLALTFGSVVDDRATADAQRVASLLAPLGITVTTTTAPGDLTARDVSMDADPFADLSSRYGKDAELAPLVARVASETNAVKRDDRAALVARVLLERTDAIPLYEVPKVVAIKQRLANATPDGFASVEWETVGWAR